MKIKHLIHTEIDKELWDKKISQAVNARIYAYSGLLDIASSGWQALVSENYEFIMPLTVRKKFFIPYIAQPKFIQQTGIFSDKKVTESVIFEFINSIPGKYKFRIIHLNSQNKISGKEISKRPNHLLNLNFPYDILYKNFSYNTKRNIKKASSGKLLIDKNISIEDAVFLKKQNNINSLSEKNLITLKNLILFTEKHFSIKIYGIKNEIQELISVVVFSFCKNRVYLPLIASSEEGKAKFSSFLIFNEFIKDYSEQNLILDFEGSSIPGIARFFEGWGAKPESYYVLNQNNLPLLLKVLKK